MQQLDLFGFPIEQAAQPRKKEKPIQPSIAIAKDPLPKSEPIVEMVSTPTPEAPVLAEPDQPVTFSQTKTNPPKTATGKRGRKSFKEMDSEADLIEIPDDEILQQKLYYSISEVAGWFKVNTSLLRYWENEFDILQPRKTRKGDRLFRVEDIKNLQLIYFLLRQRKFSIDGAKNYLKNNRKEANTQVQLVESLTKFKSFLLEMKANLAL